MKRLALALAITALTSQAQALDLYIFGYSSYNTGNYLTAGTTNLQFSDQGWYSSTGDHIPGNQNYIVGQCMTCGGALYNNWFSVDLPPVSGPVSSLSVTLDSYNVTFTAGNYYLYDYGGSIDALKAGGTGLVGIYNDLGSGAFFGSHFYQTSESDNFVTINLNSAAVADFNNAVSSGATQWAFGGTFQPGDAPRPDPNGVPEPETFALLLAGLGVMAALKRRRIA